MPYRPVVFNQRGNGGVDMLVSLFLYVHQRSSYLYIVTHRKQLHKSHTVLLHTYMGMIIYSHYSCAYEVSMHVLTYVYVKSEVNLP